jgi:hypothetical protein
MSRLPSEAPAQARQHAHEWPLSQNAAVPNRRPQLQLIAPSASPEEAAAVVAALERFMRATASAPAAPSHELDGWRRAALLEGVAREHGDDLPDPWINT